MQQHTKQQTVERRASISGIALHTGNRVNLSVTPAPPDTGIRFRRIDLPAKPEVRACIEHVVDTRRGTTIADGDAKVHTVEHMMAALAALEIDNIMVDMSGPEPPILDGSSRQFVELLQQAGTVEQNATRELIEIKETIIFEDGDTKMIVLPDPAFRIACTVKFGVLPLDCQYTSLTVTPESFLKELCAARTFCIYHEIEPLMAANLIGGGSLDNAVVITDEAILSREGLRYPDELVRHKILDIVGDLYLLGRPLRGQVIAVKPGHPSNIALARKISGLVGCER